MPVPVLPAPASLPHYTPPVSAFVPAPLPYTSPTQHHHLICKLGLSTCCARPALSLLLLQLLLLLLSLLLPLPTHAHVASILHFPKRLLPLLLLLLVYFAYIFANFGLDSPRLTAAARRAYSFIVYSQLSCSL